MVQDYIIQHVPFCGNRFTVEFAPRRCGKPIHIQASLRSIWWTASFCADVRLYFSHRMTQVVSREVADHQALLLSAVRLLLNLVRARF